MLTHLKSKPQPPTSHPTPRIWETYSLEMQVGDIVKVPHSTTVWITDRAETAESLTISVVPVSAESGATQWVIPKSQLKDSDPDSLDREFEEAKQYAREAHQKVEAIANDVLRKYCPDRLSESETPKLKSSPSDPIEVKWFGRDNGYTINLSNNNHYHFTVEAADNGILVWNESPGTSPNNRRLCKHGKAILAAWPLHLEERHPQWFPPSDNRPWQVLLKWNLGRPYWEVRDCVSGHIIGTVKRSNRHIGLHYIVDRERDAYYTSRSHNAAGYPSFLWACNILHQQWCNEQKAWQETSQLFSPLAS